MEAKERMAQLLLQVSEEENAALPSKWMDLESVLTLRELALLLRAAEFGAVSPDEPLEGLTWGRAADSLPTIFMAPFMEEWQLRWLTRQARLRRLKLLEWRRSESGELGLVLTPRGAHAVNWWLEFMEEQGMTHETLEALPWPHETRA